MAIAFLFCFFEFFTYHFNTVHRVASHSNFYSVLSVINELENTYRYSSKSRQKEFMKE